MSDRVIFHALEGLMDCKPGQNFSTLLSRLTAYLQWGPRQAAGAKRELRALYDIRSSFVHGGMTVIHPLRNDGLDSKVDDEIGKIDNAIDFGVTLLLSVLRKMTIEGRTHFIFDETLRSA